MRRSTGGLLENLCNCGPCSFPWRPMALEPCKECRNEISEAAVACPRCGAHYTVALDTYHRGLFLSGCLVAFAWLWLRIASRTLDRRYSGDILDFAGDLSIVLFVLAAVLMLWGWFYRVTRQRLVVTAD